MTWNEACPQCALSRFAIRHGHSAGAPPPGRSAPCPASHPREAGASAARLAVRLMIGVLGTVSVLPIPGAAMAVEKPTHEATPSGAGAAASTTGAGSAAQAASLPPNVMMRVNGEDVPRDRFINELNDALGESYKETFISHVIVDAKAKTLGIEAPTSEIEARVQSNIDQILRERFAGDASKMEDALKERGLTAEGWKRRLRIEGRYDLLLDRMITKERSVPEDTLKRVFEEKYGPGGLQVKIRHILKNVPVAASQDYTLQQFEQDKAKIETEARARAQEALGKLQAGESFESVMASYSDDPRKATGGVLTSWKGRFGPELDEAAGKLKKGGRSEVLRGADGYRIVECTDITESDEAHVLHILVATGARGKNRSEEEAKIKAQDLLAKVKGGADFEQLAKDNSDDPGSAARGGDLGWFGRRAMVKPFEDAAFAMQAGQISDLVQTSFGFHIIKMLERRTTEDKALRQIYVSTQFASVKDRKLRPGLEAKARAALEAAQKQLGHPSPTFAELASANSDDFTTKSDGGLLKSYRDGLYGGDFDVAVKEMKPGDTPRIVKDAAGNFHLLMVDQMVKTDFSNVRSALEAEEMQRPPSPQEKTEYVAKLRAAATIVP